MKVIVAKHAGFCMGVDLALKKLDSAISDGAKKRVVTLGPIIHNPQVLAEYKEQGVEILDNVSQIEKDMCVIIRAHGVPKEDEAQLKKEALEVVDATCPKVKAAQIAVEKSTLRAKDKYKNESLLLFYGEKEHPEVRGILSYSAIDYKVFDKPSDILEDFENLPKHLVLASQTTQDIDIFKEFSINLKKSIENQGNGTLEILNTICNATKERQEAVRELIPHIDSFIVIGGKTSGNTRRLAEISTSYNVPTYYIETVEELKNEKFQKSFTFALTAGASTPKRYIEEVKSFLESYSNQ